MGQPPETEGETPSGVTVQPTLSQRTRKDGVLGCFCETWELVGFDFCTFPSGRVPRLPTTGKHGHPGARSFDSITRFASEPGASAQDDKV